MKRPTQPSGKPKGTVKPAPHSPFVTQAQKEERILVWLSSLEVPYSLELEFLASKAPVAISPPISLPTTHIPRYNLRSRASKPVADTRKKAMAHNAPPGKRKRGHSPDPQPITQAGKNNTMLPPVPKPRNRRLPRETGSIVPSEGMVSNSVVSTGGQSTRYVHSSEGMEQTGYLISDKSQHTIQTTGRVKRRKLADCTPLIKFEPPSEIPQAVLDLRRNLFRAAELAQGVVPIGLRQRLSKKYPDDFWEEQSDSVWDSDAKNELSVLQHVTDIAKITKKLQARLYDESAWYPGIQKILNGVPVLDDDPEELEKLQAEIIIAERVQTQYLPVYKVTQKTVPSVKIDLALAYDSRENFIERILPSPSNRPAPMCPFVDVKELMVAVPVEVKSPSGVARQAEYQLSVAANAMLMILEDWAKASRIQDDNREPPVMVALSVLGHHWDYYLVYRGKPSRREIAQLAPILEVDSPVPSEQPNATDHSVSTRAPLTQLQDRGPCIMDGPWSAGNTMSLFAIFKLVKFISVLRQWVAKTWIKLMRDTSEIGDKERDESGLA